ncbi:MAG TPA: hypothetical protein VF742_04340 [Terracidiphilus sp.]
MNVFRIATGFVFVLLLVFVEAGQQTSATAESQAFWQSFKL